MHRTGFTDTTIKRHVKILGGMTEFPTDAMVEAAKRDADIALALPVAADDPQGGLAEKGSFRTGARNAGEKGPAYR
jgi:hypothetical protein